MAQASWFMPQGSCLKVHGLEQNGIGGRAWGTQRQVFRGHEPWAGALSHEPLTIKNQLIDELFEYLFWVLPRIRIPTTASAAPMINSLIQK